MHIASFCTILYHIYKAIVNRLSHFSDEYCWLQSHFSNEYCRFLSHFQDEQGRFGDCELRLGVDGCDFALFRRDNRIYSDKQCLVVYLWLHTTSILRLQNRYRLTRRTLRRLALKACRAPLIDIRCADSSLRSSGDTMRATKSTYTHPLPHLSIS